MNASDYIRNRNAFPAEQLCQYVGKYIAWSEDGTAIIASASTVTDLIAAVDANYPAGTEFVINFIPPAPVADSDPANPAGMPPGRSQ